MTVSDGRSRVEQGQISRRPQGSRAEIAERAESARNGAARRPLRPLREIRQGASDSGADATPSRAVPAI